eukprot:Skav236402  [mRNA]  locus=scaffold1702:93338:94818:- [translate_table: standard]
MRTRAAMTATTATTATTSTWARVEGEGKGEGEEDYQDDSVMDNVESRRKSVSEEVWANMTDLPEAACEMHRSSL